MIEISLMKGMMDKVDLDFHKVFFIKAPPMLLQGSTKKRCLSLNVKEVKAVDLCFLSLIGLCLEISTIVIV